MTRLQMGDKLDVVYDLWILGMKKDDAVRLSFQISFMKEFLFRMSDGDDEKANEDNPWFDKIDPQWLFDMARMQADEDDHAGEMFIADNCVSLEYFEGMLDGLERLWWDTEGDNAYADK